MQIIRYILLGFFIAFFISIITMSYKHKKDIEHTLIYMGMLCCCLMGLSFINNIGSSKAVHSNANNNIHKISDDWHQSLKDHDD
ncbi:hypothetical protein DY037_05315 [Apilactobacillus micheneri]|uniref:hypothetical protein n=1 Tax=Apilactobacillus micheneri TaxID=1899430 RepID=UPI0015E84E30|nr:hypothetical protein [Apilactobacillus micheneri]TPR49199.1 hypothetical protein DY037_05315 [Apilactobacillus micheneri]